MAKFYLITSISIVKSKANSLAKNERGELARVCGEFEIVLRNEKICMGYAVGLPYMRASLE